PILRSCSHCSAQDLEPRGVSASRAIQQVPFFSHCPVHATHLSEWRDADTTRPNSIFGLPTVATLVVPYSRESRRIFGSDGYASYLNNWARVASEELPVIAIDHWKAVVGKALALAGGVDLLA